MRAGPLAVIIVNSVPSLDLLSTAKACVLRGPFHERNCPGRKNANRWELAVTIAIVARPRDRSEVRGHMLVSCPA